MRHILIGMLIFMVSACGIPTDKQDSMRSSLSHELNESFMNDSKVLPSEIFVELKDIEKSSDEETGEYKARFVFSFHDFWDKSEYDVRGVAYFDEHGSIIKSGGEKSIRINVIGKNHKTVSSDEMKFLKPKDTMGW